MVHVLIVDDNPELRELLQMACEEETGWRTSGAANCSEAMLVAARDRPDAAIVDAVLPERANAGLVLAHRLAALGVPTLIMSGEPGHFGRLQEAKCHFLQKPFPLSQLLVEIKRLLGDGRRRSKELVSILDRLPGVDKELLRLCQTANDLIAEARALLEYGRQVRQWDWRRDCRPVCAALFDGLIGEAVAVTGADMGTMQVIDGDPERLRLVAARGFRQPFLDFFLTVDAHADSGCGAAFRQAGRIIVPDIECSPIFFGKRSGEVLREAGVRSVQATPVLDKAGQVAGMIATHRHVVWQPTEDELHHIDRVVARAAQEIEAVLR